MKKLLIAVGLAALSASASAHAQQADNKPSPQAGKKPSEILAIVESRADFARLDQMAWNDRGYYEIEYQTNDKAQVEINIDSVSGKPVEQD